jgi:acetyltransferase-like isoleucine patch superfamily enzyme
MDKSVLRENGLPFAPPGAVTAPGGHGGVDPSPEDRRLGTISIGRGTYAGSAFSVRTWRPTEQISIGRFCSIASSVTILTGGDHRTDVASTWPFDAYFRMASGAQSYQSTRNTTIGHDVWIADGVHIAGGASIGHGAVIGARSVVRGAIPPYAVCIGNPATIVRYRFSKKVVEQMLKIAWWDWNWDDVVDRRDWFHRPISEFVEHFSKSL